MLGDPSAILCCVCVSETYMNICRNSEILITYFVPRFDTDFFEVLCPLY